MNERHSRLGQSQPRQKLSPHEEARQAAENGFRQFDRLVALTRQGIEQYQEGKFRLRPSTLVEFDRLAVNGMVDGPGHFRRQPVEIEHAQHVPPSAEEVPALVDEMCEYVNDNWGKTALHLAAYVMWRLNWIHPFEDGNGRTSRAASYMVLCVRLRTELPGATTIPELISRDKQPYYKALEAADLAYSKDKTIDVSAMESLLQELMIQQVAGAANHRASRAAASQSARPTIAEPATPKATPQTAEPRSRWIIGLTVLLLTAVIGGLATMLSTSPGQRFLGCGGHGEAAPDAPAEIKEAPER